MDWEQIERDYRAGILTLREIAKRGGVSEGAVRKQAKADGWKRDLYVWTRRDPTWPIAFLEVPYRLARAALARESALGKPWPHADTGSDDHHADAGSDDHYWDLAIVIEAELREEFEKTGVMVPAAVIALFSEYGFDLQFVKGIEGDAAETKSFHTLDSVAEEGAEIEVPLKRDKRGVRQLDGQGDARRQELKTEYLRQLQEEAQAGSLMTVGIPTGGDAGAPDALLTPLGRLSALELLKKFERRDEVGGIGGPILSNEELPAEHEANAATLARGLPFMKVAQVLAAKLKVPINKMLADLERDANKGDLVYRDARTGRPVSPVADRTVVPDSDLVHPEDINKLLKEWHEPFRFPVAGGPGEEMGFGEAASTAPRGGQPTEALPELDAAPDRPPECPDAEPVQAAPVRLTLKRAQELAILAKLRELKFDPQAVPTPPGKLSPAKQAMRKALPFTEEVLKKAWQRLRRKGDLKDA